MVKYQFDHFSEADFRGLFGFGRLLGVWAVASGSMASNLTQVLPRQGVRVVEKPGFPWSRMIADFHNSPGWIIL
jgi:hypothetical protein